MTRNANFRKVAVFVAVLALICAVFAGLSFHGNNDSVLASDEEIVITLRIGDPQMTVNGESESIDESGTSPVIMNDRTLVPVRAIIEAAGGSVSWDETAREASLSYNGNTVRLVIDSTTAYFNDTVRTLDVAPVILNDRTMRPIRFISESFGFTVGWEQSTQTITITVPADTASTDPVAVDQACIDIVYNTDRSESGTLIDRIESRNGLHTLEHAAEIGYGSREYELVSID